MLYSFNFKFQLFFHFSGSHEVLSRPVHIDEHFPPMHQIVLGILSFNIFCFSFFLNIFGVFQFLEEEPAIEGSMEPIDEGITPTPENVEALMEISPSKANIFKRPDLADKRRG